MNYQILSKKSRCRASDAGHLLKNRGFTVLELLVVVAVFVLFAGLGQQAFFSFQAESNLEIATVNVVEALRHAKSNAQQVQSDTKWGVYISSTQATVFSGNSYATRNTNLDQAVSLTNGVVASGLQEIVFEKSSGVTTNVGDITLTLGTQTKTISINAKGTITY